MSLKIHPLIATLLIAGILILLFALFRGCHQSKLEVAAKEKAQLLADSMSSALIQYKAKSDSTTKLFNDSLDANKVEYTNLLLEKNSMESQLDDALSENRKLIDKHKLDKYADTSAVLTPQEYINDCESCFTKLETTTNLSIRYKNDLNALEANWRKQNELYQKQFKAIDQERLGFYSKVQTLAQQQQKELDKLKPHGRLYLSWGVLWGFVPKMAGAGLLYQNKHNLLIGATWYYGANGHMLETTLNFPLSFKIK